MYSIQTDRLVGYSDMIVTDGLIQKPTNDDNCINILSIKRSTGREVGFMFYDRNNQDTKICHVAITWQRNRTEVSYGTESLFRNKGYMQEALKAFLEWVSNSTKENNIWALPNGEESKHILEKCGFKYFGTVEGTKSSWYIFDIDRNM